MCIYANSLLELEFSKYPVGNNYNIYHICIYYMLSTESNTLCILSHLILKMML